MFFLREKILFPQSIQSKMETVFFPDGKKSEQTYAKSLMTLWRKLAIERGQTKESHYSFQYPEAQAYAAYYMPINCLKVPLVLEEALLLGKNILPEQRNVWLDVGTGPGTSWLGLEWWLQERNLGLDFLGIDQSDHFLRIAERIAKGKNENVKVNFASTKKQSILRQLEETKATHLCFMNSIAEIYASLDERKTKVKELLDLMRKLSKGDKKKRYLIVIEPGSKANSRELSELKDFCKQNHSILLPCIDNRNCGALVKPEDWCHEEVSCEFPDWIQSIGSAASMQKEAILFSYFVLEVGAEALEESRVRVVSQRLERKGQTECWICKKEGKQMIRAQKSKTNDFSRLVFQVNRGEIWDHCKIAEKGDLLEAEPVRPNLPTIFKFPSSV